MECHRFPNSNYRPGDEVDEGCREGRRRAGEVAVQGAWCMIRLWMYLYLSPYYSSCVLYTCIFVVLTPTPLSSKCMQHSYARGQEFREKRHDGTRYSSRPSGRVSARLSHLAVYLVHLKTSRCHVYASCCLFTAVPPLFRSLHRE